jgi:uncharacterized membrane protein YbaN (DUF454 family)
MNHKLIDLDVTSRVERPGAVIGCGGTVWCVSAMSGPDAHPPQVTRPPAGPVTRLLWIAAGFVCVAFGGLGAIVPGLPSTVFFIGAAACFTRSSPRLERWVLGLPGVGRMVSDHRAGLGMPRRAKAVAIAAIVVFSGLSVVVSSAPALSIGIVVFAAVGIGVVAWRVPTRERVLVTAAPARSVER